MSSPLPISDAAIVAAMGGPEAIGADSVGTLDVIRAVERGFDARAVAHLSERFPLARADLCAALAIGTRSLAHRKRTGRLRPSESERLWRAARVLCRAEEVLGDPERASRWVVRPALGLGWYRPIDLVRWEIGGQAVEQLLGRIEYGIVV